jgi:tRNA(His) 5'-end guanylyltransferase
MPVIVRIDGKAFHSFCKGLDTPYDWGLIEALDYTALDLVQWIQNARFAYTQSDEINILLIDYNRYSSEQWFDGNIQKMASVSASMATAHFNEHVKMAGMRGRPLAMFDARVFNIPDFEIVNYFIHRQKDWIRNSIMMAGRDKYSHKQLLNKSCEDVKEMLVADHGMDWDKLEGRLRFGGLINGDEIKAAPEFTGNREAVKKFTVIEEGDRECV